MSDKEKMERMKEAQEAIKSALNNEEANTEIDNEIDKDSKEACEQDACQEEVQAQADDADVEVKTDDETCASDAEEAAPKKKDPKDAVIEDLNDRIKRQMAEFDNFRKRSDKEKSEMFSMGVSDTVKKLLPVIDNFERGLKGLSDDQKEEPFAKGILMTYNQTLKMLEDLGVEPIEAVGQEFNADFHSAVMHVDDDSVGKNIVVEEFEKGYTYKDKVIRYSMVKVAN